MSDAPETTAQPTTSDAPVGGNPPLQPDAFISSDDDEVAEEPDNSGNASVEGDDTPAAQPEKPKDAKEAKAEDDDPIGDDPEEADGDDEPPEFWSAPKKALWDKITDPEVRAAIKEHTKEVGVASNRRIEEHAAKARAAEESSKAAIAKQEQDMAWWQQNGPIISTIIEGEFAGIDMDRLAKENPAQWAEVKQAKEARQNWLNQVGAHLQNNQRQVEERRATQHQAERVAEHSKLAAEFPKEFGTPEASKRTYDALGAYAVKNGIAPERVNAIYESNIVKILRKAYKYDQLQAKAREVTTPKPPETSASKTPTRVAPGARVTGPTPQSDAVRLANERLRNGEHLSREEAGWAFR
jgi:hypothetical protein